MNGHLIIKEMPIMERPREKVLHFGIESLSNCELLAILIGRGSKGYSALTLANIILKKFGNLRKLASYSVHELKNIKGIGTVKAIEIKASMELAKRFSQTPLKRGNELSSSRQVFNYFHEKLRDEKREKFFVVLLDSKHCIIKEELISIGSLNLSIVHPREVFITAIRESSESILLIHNHPSGDPKPSKEGHS